MKKILLLALIPLLSSCHAFKSGRAVADIEFYKVAYDGLQKEELSDKNNLSSDGQIRFVSVSNTSAVVEFSRGEFRSEAMEGGKFPYANGALSGIKLLKVDARERTIVISYPIGETKEFFRVIYTDGSSKEQEMP
jgi:hypothetical protein